MSARPSAWTRDEVILALDLYFSSGRKVLDTYRPETVELAAVLNRIHADDGQGPCLPRRTAGSVKAKLANLRALDPSTQSTGWGNGSRIDLEVWTEFANRPEALRQAASMIRHAQEVRGTRQAQ